MAALLSSVIGKLWLLLHDAWFDLAIAFIFVCVVDLIPVWVYTGRRRRH